MDPKAELAENNAVLSVELFEIFNERCRRSQAPSLQERLPGFANFIAAMAIISMPSQPQ
jgi:hypothetical protein